MNRLDIPLTQAFWPSDSKNVIAVLPSIAVFELKAEKHSKITYFLIDEAKMSIWGPISSEALQIQQRHRRAFEFQMTPRIHISNILALDQVFWKFQEISNQAAIKLKKNTHFKGHIF